MRVWQAGLVVLAVLPGACATAQRGDEAADSRTAAERGLPPCDTATVAAISGPGVPGDWREVRADGFRLCVPADWSVGSRAWQGAGGIVAWVPFRERDEQIARQAPLRFPTTEPWANVEEVEIGGTRAIVWDRLTQTPRSNRRAEWQPYDYQTGAMWRDHAVKLDGMAQTRHAAQLQRRVYQTVRFDTPSDPPGRGAGTSR